MDIKEFKSNNTEIFENPTHSHHQLFDFNSLDNHLATKHYISYYQTEISPNNVIKSNISLSPAKIARSISCQPIINNRSVENSPIVTSQINFNENFMNKEYFTSTEKITEDQRPMKVIGISQCQRYWKYDQQINENDYKRVYRGFDVTDGRQVAWCEIKNEYIDKGKYQSVLNDIDVMLKLDHPNIIKCFDVLKNWLIFLDDSDSSKTEVTGLVMILELLNEGTLKSVFEKNLCEGSYIPDKIITKWWYDILDALRYIHSRIQSPIIHRNINSENCFIFHDLNENCISVKICDFVLPSTVEKNRNADVMTSEIFEEKYDVKIDIHAFGMLMLEGITNDIYFDNYANIYQIITKTMVTHSPNVISNKRQSLINEIILSCLHQHPYYRPTAEELCEHPFFQNAPVVVELLNLDLNRINSVLEAADDIFRYDTAPVLTLQISVMNTLPREQFNYSQLSLIIFSLDIYQSYKTDLSELLSALRLSFENETRRFHWQTSDLDQLILSIKLQLRYIIKITMGEKWRRIFHSFFNGVDNLREKEKCRPIQTFVKNDFKNTITTNEENKFTEHHFSFSSHHKVSNILNIELENYCRECKLKGIPYFFNMYMKHNKQTRSPIEDCLPKAKPFRSLSDISNSQSLTEINYDNFINETNPKINTIPIEVTPIKINENTLEISKRKETLEFNSKHELNQTHCYDSSYIKSNEEQIPVSKQFSKLHGENNYNFQNDLDHGIRSFPVSSSSINSTLNKQQFVPVMNIDQIHFRHFSEPSMYTAKSIYPINSIYSIGSNINSGTNPTQIDISTLKSLHTNYPHFTFNQDINHSVGFANNNNSQTAIGSNSNIFLQQSSTHQQTESQQIISYIQSNFIPNQSKLIVSPQNLKSGQGNCGIYGGSYCVQSEYITTNKYLNMQNNGQYTNPLDHTPRHQTTEPTLTRSLPSIIGNTAISVENAVGPNIIQSSMAPGSTPRVPAINNTLGSNDVISSPRQIYVGNNNQKLNPLVSTNKAINRAPAVVSPIPTSKQPQTQWTTTHIRNNTAGSQLTYQPISDNISVPLVVKTRSESTSSVIVPSSTNNSKKVVRGRSFSQVQEKSKSKKTKTRIKSKYLLKVTEIAEVPGSSEVIISFEMSLPMNQLRFNYSLNNEINFPNLSKAFGDSAPISGELRKKDILESLVTTIEKICHCLKEDINSISLNEDYVFHPLHSNLNLLKFSDCTYQMQISSEVYESAQSSNPCSYLNTIPAQICGSPLMMNSSSRSLSRHASTEDLSWTGNPHISQPERPRLPTAESIISVQSESNKTTNSVGDFQKKPLKPSNEIDPNPRMVSVTSKCTCNPATKDCCFRIPEYLYPSVKQIIEKLQNPHTKGLIILPQSNEILIRNPRVLEIPPDHMFCGLPCPDSSFNVVKGHKDKYFIIAKDTRQTDNTEKSSKKCVYQISPEGAVLVDSTGEIQYLQNPSIVIPQSQSKAQVNELPFELTHNKDQLLDCNQIVSVLQSLSQNQNSSELTKDETFDSPVLLKPVNHQSGGVIDKTDVSEFPQGARRGSGDSIQNQSQVHVDCVSVQYVTLAKSSSKQEFEQGIELSDRDLPRQQVRNRKISNESLDAASSSRSRMPQVYTNELDHHSSPQQQPAIPKMIVTNSSIVGMHQNVTRPIPGATHISQIPMHRIPNIPTGTHSGQFVLTAQNPGVSQMAPNLLSQNFSYISPSQYGVPTSGATGGVVITQSNPNVPVVLPNQNPIGINFSPMVQNQAALSTGLLPNQMPQVVHSQSQRLVAPAGMPISSQHLSNIPGGMSIQNLMNVSQSMIPTPILPGYSVSIHNSIPTATSDQHHYIPLSHPTEFMNFNVRQIPVGNTSFYDANVNNSLLSDHPMLRMRMNQPSSIPPSAAQSQSQPGSIVYIPFPNPSSVTTAASNPVPTPPIPAGNINQSKIVLSDQLLPAPAAGGGAVVMNQLQSDNTAAPQPQSSNTNTSQLSAVESSSEKKTKVEQTIGRFVVRSVTDSADKS